MVLIAGDAFTTTWQESFTAVLTQRLEFHGPPAYYTSDWEAARASVQRLAALEPAVVACGHGLPVSGAKASGGLKDLADFFMTNEVPACGPYVGHPALADELGVIMVPPPVFGPPASVLGGTLGGMLAYMLVRSATRGVRANGPEA